MLNNFWGHFLEKLGEGQKWVVYKKKWCSDIKLLKTETRSYLVSEPSYHAKKNYPHLSPIEAKTTQIIMNKTVYSYLAMSEINKILMHEFGYDYMEPEHGEKLK